LDVPSKTSLPPAVHRQNGGKPREFQGGKPWRGNVCLFANANKQTCDFGLPKSIFIGSFFAAWQRMNIKNQTTNAYFAHGEMIEVLFAR